MFKSYNIGKYGEIQHFLYSLIRNFVLWPKFFGWCIPKLSGSYNRKAVHCPNKSGSHVGFSHLVKGSFTCTCCFPSKLIRSCKYLDWLKTWDASHINLRHKSVKLYHFHIKITLHMKCIRDLHKTNIVESIMALPFNRTKFHLTPPNTVKCHIEANAQLEAPPFSRWKSKMITCSSDSYLHKNHLR